MTNSQPGERRGGGVRLYVWEHCTVLWRKKRMNLCGFPKVIMNRPLRGGAAPFITYFSNEKFTLMITLNTFRSRRHHPTSQRTRQPRLSISA